jgi:succinoglycan biosynthesis transport protein ExoP
MPIHKDDSPAVYEINPPEKAMRPLAEDITLLSVANLLLRNRRLIVLITLLLWALILTKELLQPPAYNSTATFMSQNKKPASGILGGLADQVGLQIGGSDPGESPQFYMDLVRSREILRSVSRTNYVIHDGSRTIQGPFADLARIRQPDSARRDALALKALNESITTSVSAKTGVVTLGVRSFSPELAKLLADKLLEELEKFNLERRQSQAAEERRFTEQRLAEVKASLTAAENRLQEFYQGNQQFKNASQLTVERDRYVREETNLQQVYTALAQALEKARIEEVRNTPVITVIDRPEQPTVAESRHWIQKFLMGILGGLALGLLLGFLRDSISGPAAERSNDADNFARLKRETIRDLRHPISAFRRR